MTSLWPYRSSEVKGQGAKWKPRYDFLSKVNSNCMPILYRFQDIGSFNNLLIKLINLITMVWSSPNSIDFRWLTKTRVNYQSKSLWVYLAPFWRYWEMKTLYCYCDLSRSSRSKVMMPNERLYTCSYLWIIVTICLTGTVSKILALFYKKNRLCAVTWPEMHLMTPRLVQCSAHNFVELFGSNQKSLSLKMAEIWPIL